MFLLKQFLKQLVLPPTSWILLLLAVLIFWRRRWARKLLFGAIVLIVLLHSAFVERFVRHGLESRYAPVVDPRRVQPYDAIVVLTGGFRPAGGLVPFPSVGESMFQRLDEAWRLYRIVPKPVIVAGGHVDPFTPSQDENRIARDYLLRWGVPAEHIIGEENSRDTFETALEVKKILDKRGWKKYLLVTSASHMPRSMLVFSALVPEPIPAPGDFTVDDRPFSPLNFFPTTQAARGITSAIHEYIGLANYRWRLWRYGRQNPATS